MLKYSGAWSSIKARVENDPFAGDKLFRNDGNHFVDVTPGSGILTNALGYGLGVAISDINKDGWPDIYVTNDYIEPDYLYINNKDGTFTNKLSEYVQHISLSAMGNDINDFNNDTWPDIFTTDMLSADNKRLKASLWNGKLYGICARWLCRVLSLNNAEYASVK